MERLWLAQQLLRSADLDHKSYWIYDIIFVLLFVVIPRLRTLSWDNFHLRI
jgi:hypothetical protein